MLSARCFVVLRTTQVALFQTTSMSLQSHCNVSVSAFFSSTRNGSVSQLFIACRHKGSLSFFDHQALVLSVYISERNGLSLALKVRAGTEQGDALVHDGLADPEVVFKPLEGAGVFAEGIWL